MNLSRSLLRWPRACYVAATTNAVYGVDRVCLLEIYVSVLIVVLVLFKVMGKLLCGEGEYKHMENA